MMGVSDNKKIGMFMAGLGGVFMFLGVILFFDSALLGLGNVLFLGAFPFLIGVRKTMALFNPMARNARYVHAPSLSIVVLPIAASWRIGGGRQCLIISNNQCASVLAAGLAVSWRSSAGLF